MTDPDARTIPRLFVRHIRLRTVVALAVIGVLASVVGAYYYLYIVKLMYFDEPVDTFEQMPYELRVVLAICGLFNIFFFLYPAPLVGIASAAAHSLF